MPKRILLVHRYFWPDVPTYAQMLRFIGSHLVGEGHDVSVFCGPPSYNDVYDGPKRPRTDTVDGLWVHRVALPPDRKSQPLLRALSLLVFALRLVVHVVAHRRRYDLLTVTTIPPVVMGLCARVIKRLTGIGYVYHCMDLYPEVAEISGMARRSWLVRAAKRIDAGTCRNASVVVVLSQDMRDTLARRGLDTGNVVVLNNFEVTEPGDRPEQDVLPRRDGSFRVLFAGNMGRFQGVEHLVTAAHRLAREIPQVEFAFMGAGACVEALKAQAGELVGTTVHFVKHQPVATAAAVMRDSQLAVVSLRPRVHEVAYPSKTAMYLNAGCRIVAVVEEHSELAALIRDHDLGVTCPPDDVDALTDAVRAEAARKGASRDERARAVEIGEREFGRAAKLAEWSRLVARIGEER